MTSEDAVVSISYDFLCTSPSDGKLFEALSRAFGPGGLGLLSVSGIPELISLRNALLPLGQSLADLPPSVLQSLEDPPSHFSFGWSRGQEKLEGGKPDFAKGSFYANPRLDVPTTDPALLAEFPSYCRPNVWPEKHLPQLRTAFRAACAAVMEAGERLAAHADAYVARAFPNYVPRITMAEAIRASPCNKARLLHYYPPGAAQDGADGQEAAEGEDAPWCTIHTDHGALTGLLSAAYIQKDGEGRLREVPSPDPSAGLYVRLADGTDVQVRIPVDHVAFQLGEVMQILSGGELRATPHYVRAPAKDVPGARLISRNTLAVFMQPSWALSLDAPEGREQQIGISRWKQGMTFGRFSEITFSQYYDAKF